MNCDHGFVNFTALQLYLQVITSICFKLLILNVDCALDWLWLTIVCLLWYVNVGLLMTVFAGIFDSDFIFTKNKFFFIRTLWDNCGFYRLSYVCLFWFSFDHLLGSVEFHFTILTTSYVSKSKLWSYICRCVYCFVKCIFLIIFK